MSLKMFNFALVNQGIPEKLTLFRHDNTLVRARSAFSPHFISREHNYLCIKKIPPPVWDSCSSFRCLAREACALQHRHIGSSVMPV